MSDGARQASIACKDVRHVDGIVITRNTSICFIRCRRLKEQWGLATQWDGILKVDRLFDGSTMSPKVIGDKIAVRNASLIFNASNMADLFTCNSKST